MGLTWNLSAAVATIALLLIGGAVYNKARQKKDSPIYRIIEKFKRKKTEDEIYDEQQKYRRLNPAKGVKWAWLTIL